MSDPFFIEGPACINFSGGRTSGYMLWRILQSHGGKLPDDVIVCFNNTGKEMEESLDFVRECGERWGVHINWLEFDINEPCTLRESDLHSAFKVVDFSTASRNGEPFEKLIRFSNSSYLPNPIARQCTVQMKMRTTERFIRKTLGWDEWDSVIGIRGDEPYRYAKIVADPSGGRSGITRLAPLAQAKIDVAEVGRFWMEQPFDLRLPNMNGITMHGNCDLCFLKGGKQVLALIREQPKRADWWARMEREYEEAFGNDKHQARFRKDRPSYAAMHRMATTQVEMFKFDDEALQDCACTD